MFKNAGWEGFGDFLLGFVKWIGEGIGGFFSAVFDWVRVRLPILPPVSAVLKGFSVVHEIIVAIILYVLIMNIITFFIFGMDKRRARAKAERVSEKTLFRLCLAGGALGGMLGMKVYHHKTLHNKFKYGVPVIFFVELIIGSFCVGFLMYWVYM